MLRSVLYGSRGSLQSSVKFSSLFIHQPEHGTYQAMARGMGPLEANNSNEAAHQSFFVHRSENECVIVECSETGKLFGVLKTSNFDFQEFLGK